MKQRTILFLLLALPLVVFAQSKKVAILETVDKSGEVSYVHKLMVRTSLAKAITETEGLEAYDRTDMDAIMSEQDFQRTGMVSNDQIKRLGEMTGAQYILVAELAPADNKKYFLTAKILDVETARTELTDYILMDNTTQGIAYGCKSLADKMFGNKSLAEKVFGSMAKPAAKPFISQESENTSNDRAAARTAKEETPKQTTQPKRAEKVEKEEVAVVTPEHMLEHKRGVDGWRFVYYGNEMDKKAYQDFLRNTCPDAFVKYRDGKRTAAAGWVLFGAGCLLTAGGTATCAILWDYYYDEYKKYRDSSDPKWKNYAYDCNKRTYLCEDLMFSCAGVGSGLVFASIITLPIGYARMNKKSVDIFNARCNDKGTALNFGITSGSNGIGLAMQF